MQNDINETQTLLKENSPFLDSIKRIGQQARNWEQTSDFGTHLDILSPTQRRRIVFTPRMLVIVFTLFVLMSFAQTFVIYRELRSQRATIEQLKSVLTKPTVRAHNHH